VTSRWSVRGFQFQKFWFLTAESLIRLYAGDGRGRGRAEQGLERRGQPGGHLPLPDAHRPAAQRAAAVRWRLPWRSRGARQGGAFTRPSGAPVGWARSRFRRSALADLLWGGRRSAPEDRRGGDMHRTSGAGIRPAGDGRLRPPRCQLPGSRERLPPFLPDEGVANPEAMMRMLAPGFPEVGAPGSAVCASCAAQRTQAAQRNAWLPARGHHRAGHRAWNVACYRGVHTNPGVPMMCRVPSCPSPVLLLLGSRALGRLWRRGRPSAATAGGCEPRWRWPPTRPLRSRRSPFHRPRGRRMRGESSGTSRSSTRTGTSTRRTWSSTSFTRKRCSSPSALAAPARRRPDRRASASFISIR
jgi:hypothetical protein